MALFEGMMLPCPPAETDGVSALESPSGPNGENDGYVYERGINPIIELV